MKSTPGRAESLPREMTGDRAHWPRPPSNANPALPSRHQALVYRPGMQPTAKIRRLPETRAALRIWTSPDPKTRDSSEAFNTKLDCRAPSCACWCRISCKSDPSKPPPEAYQAPARGSSCTPKDPCRACARMRSEPLWGGAGHSSRLSRGPTICECSTGVRRPGSGFWTGALLGGARWSIGGWREGWALSAL